MQALQLVQANKWAAHPSQDPSSTWLLTWLRFIQSTENHDGPALQVDSGPPARPQPATPHPAQDPSPPSQSGSSPGSPAGPAPEPKWKKNLRLLMKRRDQAGSRGSRRGAVDEAEVEEEPEASDEEEGPGWQQGSRRGVWMK
ncbi:hypothetical protein KUCAC02_035187, partial [Chaenocephalus aceratus]